MSKALSPQGLSSHPRETVDEMKDAAAFASQGQRVWQKFRKHKVAMVSLVVLILLYLGAIFAEFVAPYEKNYRIPDVQFSSPMTASVFEQGKGFSRPFVFAVTKQLDMNTFTYETVRDPSQKWYLRFLVKTDPYKLLGFIPVSHRLFGVDSGYISLFGTDNLGMDIFSQTLYASRISLSIGLIGVAISFLIGTILGGISGYFGGTVDLIIQRFIEFVISIPQLPLWLALSAAFPNEWTGIETFFALTIVLSLVTWTNLARIVRGRLISMREEEYVMAARVYGSSAGRIITRHLLPGFMSYLLVDITLAIPAMILGETTLSFLGVGILPPELSWGAMLKDANNLTMIFNYTWYLTPCIFVILTVLAFNFVGDGLRDAADPYSR
jgi:peptide/nickel transport system permease protein